MDELTLLRTVREDAAPASDDTIDAGRRALVERIGSRPPKRHRRLKRAGWISGGTVVALGVGATLVLTNVVGLAGWRGGADAAAAESLGRAAAATITASDPVVGPGQYLKIDTVAVYAGVEDDSTSLAHQDGQMYVPADHAGDWVWVRDPMTVVQTFGTAPEDVQGGPSSSDEPEIIRAAGGAWYNGRPTAWGLDALPRDPQQLLNYIYRVTIGQGPSPDTEALVFIADTLRTGVVPADLRSSLYRALAGIPGVTISDRQATLDGRTGIAFGRDEPAWGERQEVIIDPTTGLMIGERQVALTDHTLPGVPAGTVVGWTAVTTTVVDSAPAGGSICGRGSHPVGGKGSGQCQDDAK
jgi:hypothetical protein